MPRVAVLLASFNGEKWIEYQLRSILSQRAIEVRIYVSDHGSTDGTKAIVEGLGDTRVEFIQPPDCGNGPAGNFFHLLRLGSWTDWDAEFVAFADQDDVWHPDKLAHALLEMMAHEAAGYSGSVLATWPDGRERVLRKAHKMTANDYLFESPGPGCTMVFDRALATYLQSVMDRDELSAVDYHDWLVYAVARGANFRWVIDERPMMLYRQHDSNALGAASGGGYVTRARRVLDGWYANQVGLIAEISGRGDHPIVRRVVAGQLLAPRSALVLRRSRLRSLGAYAVLNATVCLNAARTRRLLGASRRTVPRVRNAKAGH